MKIHRPGAFMPPGLSDKLTDLNALARAGGVNDKRVLNQGPSYPIDEILLGPYSKEWVAIDYDPEVIINGREIGLADRIKLVHGSIAEMPADWKGYFDLVLNFSTLDNIEPDLHAKCFAEVHRVLRPGGFFLMTYGNHRQLTPKIVRSGGWIEYHFDPEEVETCLGREFVVRFHEVEQARAAILVEKR